MISTTVDFPQYSPEGRQLIQRAYDVAAGALKEEVRSDGSPFIGHPLAVARIVADEIGLPPECVAAVFLHEATRVKDLDIRSLHFDESVYTMVEGLNRISTINPKDTRLEAENYKKLIIQYSRDPRVTVLKLADRLEVMRSLKIFPKTSRERKILETLMLYIPLAHQLGLYNMKREMEDTYLSYAEPEQYRLITNKLKATEKDREKLMAEFIEPLKSKLDEAGIKYKLKIRTKSAYSIWCKMVKQKVPFEGVFDVFAIRFIIDCDGEDHKLEKDLCWRVYSFVTEEYEADTNRLRDWVSNPKPNGYESLHITVKNRDGAYVEVQIRTRRMDDVAENGFASHWSYKGVKSEEAMTRWLTSVRFALEHPDTDGPEDLPQPPSKDIFVFTPTGELRILPAGATVLDFAFGIHTNIGAHCVGAKVNGKAVSIREKLNTGDSVEILTSRNQRPNQDWLGWVVSSKARSKVKQALLAQEQSRAADGKELLGRRLRNWKLELPDDMLTEFRKKQGYPTLTSFYAAIGDESLDVNVVKDFILSEEKRRQEAQEAAEAAQSTRETHRRDDSKDDILVLNAKDVKGIDYKMAKCCNPVFGDDVFGFVTREAGIKIHRITCPNASRLLELYPYRIQKVRWADTPSSGTFQVGIKVVTDLESPVLNKVMEVVSQFKASIRSFNVNENQRSGTYEISMKLSVPSNLELDKVLSQLRIQKHVIKVTRV
ncbi:MAG: bifunctional (p)ppGpp synthetase/guanosine-3',5'-bis(diphosphate) 3'-pyrophosphohydrolase [Bacteroidales bacterium]|nr:bifunctional (p)ppGpp synthetase/guanosine-3',5'-bis(diphosphate) 3'-pyrophosphohydrolase [Bacteroidales bacterium]